MKTLYCPKCGKQLSVDDDTDYCFCMYCGNKIEIDQNIESHSEENRDREKNRLSTIEFILLSVVIIFMFTVAAIKM